MQIPEIIVSSHKKKAHMRTHTGDKSYHCLFCEKSFTKCSNLQIHTRTHNGEKPYTCKLCHTFFTQSCNLRKHLRTQTGEKPFRCQFCQKLFTQSSNLNTHMRTHTGEKPYKCQLCEKSFARGSNLKSHMRTHTGEKPYKCQLCQKGFARFSHLEMHTRAHTGVKPHKCQLCQKSLKTAATLKSHMLTHSREAPCVYLCEHCNKRFTCVGDLHRHRRMHATEKQHTPFKLKNSSSVQPVNLYAETACLKAEKQSTVRFKIDRPNELLLINMHPVSSEGTSPLEECISTSTTKSPGDIKPFLGKAFGCGICGEMLEFEKEFQDHCSNHRFSPPDDLFIDICRFLIPID